MIFPLTIVALFFGATLVEMSHGNGAKAVFYFLSALINLNIIFLK